MIQFSHIWCDMSYNYTCNWCNKAFTKPQRSRSSRQFCSRKCYSTFQRTYEGDPVCKRCNKPLTGPQRYRKQVYCSISCRRADTFIEKVCPQCGETFSVPPSTAERYTVCSRACRLATATYEICERCGKTFTGEKGRIRRFCSEECRRPPLIKTCRNCQREFRDVPSNGKQFCSFACYRRFQGENALGKSALRLIPFLLPTSKKLGSDAIRLILLCRITALHSK